MSILKFMKSKPVIAGMVFATILSAATIIYAMKGDTVQLTLDGKEQTVTTSAVDVKTVLSEAGVEPSTHDYVNVDLNTKVEEEMAIVWKPANHIFLDIDGQASEKWTTEKTVEGFFEEAGVTLAEKDKASHEPDTAIEDNMTVSIQKAFSVNVIDNGNTTQVVTTPKTVNDLLIENGITLGATDRVEPATTEAVAADMTINIFRQATAAVVVDVEIPFETVETQDGTINKGETKVSTEGLPGIKQQTFNVVYENGVEISRILATEVVTKEKVDKVILIGTKVASVPTETSKSKKQVADTTPKTQVKAPVPPTSGDANALIQYGKQFIGTRYVYGGSTPSGFDCTGFVTYCFRNVSGKSLPRSSSSYKATLSLAQMQPGDVIIFDNNSDGVANHAGIYMGNGYFIHCSSYHNIGVIVTHISEGNYQKRFMGGARY